MAATRKPGAKNPTNQSRAAGAAARPSAAAKAPMDGAVGGAPKSGFYNPEPASQLAGAASPPDAQAEPTKVAGFQHVYAEQVRHGSMPIERGGSVDREVVEHMAADAITDEGELAREIARIRQTRRPIGAYSQKLALPKRNGYHRHWFNDTAGRIEEAENNGWTFIKGKDGKNISRCVGTGRDKGAMYAFAMEIPEVFWLEDMAARNAAATDKVDALKSTPFRAKAGEATAADRGKFYDPSDTAPLQVVKG